MTLCWNCDNSYAISRHQCPRCDAVNANADLATAGAQLLALQDFGNLVVKDNVVSGSAVGVPRAGDAEPV